MYLTVGGFSFYNLLEHYLVNSGNDKKLMYNRISLTHNLSSILFIMRYCNNPENLFLSDLAVGNTLGFFINDSLKHSMRSMWHCYHYQYYHTIKIILNFMI